MPQHLVELMGLAIAAHGMVSALPLLIHGTDPALEDWSRRRVRLLAVGGIFLSVGIAASASSFMARRLAGCVAPTGARRATRHWSRCGLCLSRRSRSVLSEATGPK